MGGELGTTCCRLHEDPACATPSSNAMELVVNNGILYRYYSQPREYQGYLQLVLPTEMREQILRELHEGIGSGHLRRPGQNSSLTEGEILLAREL